MKRSLGRIIVLIVIFNTTVFGMSYQWRVVEAPQSLRVGQSGVIRYSCTFDKSDAEYSAKLQLADNPRYSASILSEKSRVVQGKRIDMIDLLMTPKSVGIIDVRMKALIRYTPSGAIENTVLGRDNISRDDIEEEEAVLPVVTIRAQENSAALTGHISLEARVDQTKVRAHEPVHLSIIIKGSGNLERFVPYELNISGVRIFAEPPQKLLTPSSDGVEGEIRQEFALVAEKPYGIPPFTLSVFDTSSNKAKMLTTQMIHIDVSEGYAISNLLDPPNLSNTATLKRYALYTALVIFGMMMGEGFRRVWKYRPRRKVKQFWERAKNTKELILMLALSGDKRYESIIGKLETGKIGLADAKKKLDNIDNMKLR